MRLLTIALFTGSLACSGVAGARDTYVQGHTRKDGTYVQGHYRSNPDSSRANNYSTEGNVNPYTGQAGTVPLYGTTPRPAAPQAIYYAPAPPVSSYRPSPAATSVGTSSANSGPWSRYAQTPASAPLAEVTTSAGLIARCESALGIAAPIAQAGECDAYITAIWEGYIAGSGANPTDICPPAGATARNVAALVLLSAAAGKFENTPTASGVVLKTLREQYPCR